MMELLRQIYALLVDIRNQLAEIKQLLIAALRKE
jgi:hypothetical protein